MAAAADEVSVRVLGTWLETFDLKGDEALGARDGLAYAAAHSSKSQTARSAMSGTISSTTAACSGVE